MHYKMIKIIKKRTNEIEKQYLNVPKTFNSIKIYNLIAVTVRKRYCKFI